MSINSCNTHLLSRFIYPYPPGGTLPLFLFLNPYYQRVATNNTAIVELYFLASDLKTLPFSLKTKWLVLPEILINLILFYVSAPVAE